MNAELKPYPEYRESGLLWVGQMPEHWALAPNRAMLKKHKVLVGKRHVDYKLLSLTKAGVIVRDISTGKGKFSADMGTSQEVRNGDLVFCLFDVPETPRTVGLSRYDGMITGAYTVFECSDSLLATYLENFYKAMDDSKLLSPLYSGLRNTIPPPRFLGTKTPLPPPEEQAAIVRFLNHTNQRIERTIRAKRKVIALLNEQKQVIIHRAVTRGLDPNVRLKPSGIPWLGEIPESWELCPLKGACLVQSGITLGKYYGNCRLQEYPYLRVANVQSGHLNLGVVKKLQLPSNEARRSLLAIGDVLMTEGGDPDKLGRGCVWDGQIENCVHQNHVFAVRPNIARLLPYYLSALLGSSYAKTYFILTAKQTTNLASTNKTTIGRFRVPLPSIEEQQKILDGLDLLTSPISLAIDHTEREIVLLREYRTRLIADVVTGKLDVREAAARLPDEVEENDDAILDDDDVTGEEVADVE